MGNVVKGTSNKIQCFHECEVFKGRSEFPEIEYFNQRQDACEKNPRHRNFVPVLDLIEDDMKLNHHQRKLLREFSDRVVRVSVFYTSSVRPDDDYFADDRGKSDSRFGTGFVFHVSQPIADRPCSCVLCEGRNKTAHWEIFVRTARHVVYNTEEAKQTKIDLFYDDNESLENGDVKSVWGIKLQHEYYDPSIDIDESVVVCVTHDKDVAERIESNKSHWSPLVNLSPKYYRDEQGFLQSLPEAQKNCVSRCALAVIFSHPHSLLKRVSVGKWIVNKHSGKNQSHIEYETPTCPGCSGAPVVLIHASSDLFDPQFFLWTGVVHTGTYTPTKSKDQRNYSKDSKHTYPVIEH